MNRKSPVTVREIVASDRSDWLRMRNALWPGSLTDHDAETQRYFDERNDRAVTIVAEVDGRLVGFLELDHRKYAEGCESSPVPFIEGWYVDPAMRGRGVGRALVEAAEARARALGYREIASDAEIDNADGIATHRALGYEEIGRVVCFRKALREI
ncbi:MAG TPA: GNAT family N-acetyltransferase [bacterium]